MNPEQYGEILRQLGGIQATQEAILVTVADQKSRLDSHSDRIRSLEQQRSWLVGAAAAVSAGVATMAHWLNLFPR
jgi:hypothetical protein